MSDLIYHARLVRELKLAYERRLTSIAQGVPQENYWNSVGYLAGLKTALELASDLANKLSGSIPEEIEAPSYDS